MLKTRRLLELAEIVTEACAVNDRIEGRPSVRWADMNEHARNNAATRVQAFYLVTWVEPAKDKAEYLFHSILAALEPSEIQPHTTQAPKKEAGDEII